MAPFFLQPFQSVCVNMYMVEEGKNIPWWSHRDRNYSEELDTAKRLNNDMPPEIQIEWNTENFEIKPLACIKRYLEKRDLEK